MSIKNNTLVTIKISDVDLISAVAYLEKKKGLAKIKTKEAREYYYNIDETDEGIKYSSLESQIQDTISLYVFSDTKPANIRVKGFEHPINNINELKFLINNIGYTTYTKDNSIFDNTDITPFYKHTDSNFKKIIKARGYYQTISIKEVRDRFETENILDATNEELMDYKLLCLKHYLKREKDYYSYLKDRSKKRELIIKDDVISNFFDVENIMNNINIYSLLSFYNIKFKDTLGDEIMCSSPFRKDRNPSFSINKKTMLWIDFAGCESGNIISLVSKLEGFDTKKDFKKILQILSKI